MTRNDLASHELKRLLHYDPETGVFTRRVTTAPHRGRAGDVAGMTNDQGYRVIAVHSKQYRAHRLAWLYMTGEWPTGEVDHKNGVRDDNRWDNLRDVPTTINAQNKRRAMSNNKTGLLGASWSEREQKFVARIKVGHKYRSLGQHDTAEAAHAVYVEAKRRLHEGCTI